MDGALRSWLGAKTPEALPKISELSRVLMVHKPDTAQTPQLHPIRPQLEAVSGGFQGGRMDTTGLVQ